MRQALDAMLPNAEERARLLNLSEKPEGDTKDPEIES
jgi:hypothetical protein